MSIEVMEMFYIACDECNASAFEGQEYAAYTDQDSAITVFQESHGDWSQFGDKHRCPEHNPFCERCGGDAGELSGERDFLCPSCWESA